MDTGRWAGGLAAAPVRNGKGLDCAGSRGGCERWLAYRSF